MPPQFQTQELRWSGAGKDAVTHVSNQEQAEDVPIVSTVIAIVRICASVIFPTRAYRP
jgi:hypothetical protein